MTITRRRTAISQSMDLFIIIAAVLGVGGIVTTSIYSLVNSAASNTSITVVGASVVGGSSSSSAPEAISLTVKNNGGSPIACTSDACVVTLASTNEGSSPATVSCSAACLTSAPAGWSLTAASANAPLQFTYVSATPLAPGAQTSLSVNSMTIGGTTTGVSMPAHGSTVTVNVVFGTSSAQVTITAQ